MVDFIIIGAQKCATTTLFDVLNHHPKLNGSSDKEPQFFSKSDNWQSNIEEYHKLFAFDSDKLNFEASTTYSFFPQYPETADRIKTYNSEIKIIYLIRNPFKRIVSAYQHITQAGYVKGSISEVIRSSNNIINVTKYYSQIEQYAQRFDQNQILILDFDEFTQNRNLSLKKISTFLGIDIEGFSNVPLLASNTRKRYKKNQGRQRLTIVERGLRKVFPALWARIENHRVKNINTVVELDSSDKEFIKTQLLDDTLMLEKYMNVKFNWFNL